MGAAVGRLSVTAFQGVLALVATPLLLTRLGVREFGAYALIVALPALVPFLDFGLGALVTARVAERVEDVTSDELRADLSASAALLIFVALCGGVATAGAAMTLNWADILGLSGVPHVQRA